MTQRYLCVRFDSWKRKPYLETISILYESNLKINFFFLCFTEFRTGKTQLSHTLCGKAI